MDGFITRRLDKSNNELKKIVDNNKYEELLKEIRLLPDKIQEILKKLTGKIQRLSSKFAAIHDAFYIGRGLDYAI